MQLFENIISYYGVIEGFVVRDLKDRYKSSYLGFFWTILHPLSLVVTYTFVFKYVFKVQIDHYVIYLLSGLIPWIFFTTAITNSSESIVHNFHLLNKVYFPREIFPIAIAVGQFIHFLISMTILLIAIICFTHIHISSYYFILPFLMMVQFFLILGSSFLFSMLMVYLKDVPLILNVVFQFLFFLCPIAYHLEAVPQKYRTLYLLNPFALIIHLYHQVIIFNNFEFNGHVFYVCFFSFLVMYISYFLFKRKEWEFVERA